MANIVAIVGRPNVGKSTFFNRLTESRKAIVDEQSGVTRDRHYGRFDWAGKDFTVIDTGGYVSDNEDVFNEAIREQVALALEECSVVLFMVDVQTGITDLDEDMANVLRRTDKPIFLVANKVDSSSHQLAAAEFYNLGFGEVYQVSANSGAGTGELLDEVVKEFNDDELEDTEGLPKISIVVAGSYGAGNYAMCGRSLSPDFIFAWPNSHVAVMGAAQAGKVLRIVAEGKQKASGQESNPQMLDFLEQSTTIRLEQQSTALFNTAMMHDDGIIDPRDTRKLLIFLLQTIYEAQQRELNPTRFGVSRF